VNATCGLAARPQVAEQGLPQRGFRILTSITGLTTVPSVGTTVASAGVAWSRVIGEYSSTTPGTANHSRTAVAGRMTVGGRMTVPARQAAVATAVAAVSLGQIPSP